MYEVRRHVRTDASKRVFSGPNATNYFKAWSREAGCGKVGLQWYKHGTCAGAFYAHWTHRFKCLAHITSHRHNRVFGRERVKLASRVKVVPLSQIGRSAP
jgi:hypothetical protein